MLLLGTQMVSTYSNFDWLDRAFVWFVMVLNLAAVIFFVYVAYKILRYVTRNDMKDKEEKDRKR